MGRAKNQNSAPPRGTPKPLRWMYQTLIDSMRIIEEMKYAFGIVGIVAAAALAAMIGKGVRLEIVIPGFLIGMVLLFVVVEGIKPGKSRPLLSSVLLWSITLLFIFVVITVMSAIVFQRPRGFCEFLIDVDGQGGRCGQGEQSIPAPAPAEIKKPLPIASVSVSGLQSVEVREDAPTIRTVRLSGRNRSDTVSIRPSHGKAWDTSVRPQFVRQGGGEKGSCIPDSVQFNDRGELTISASLGEISVFPGSDEPGYVHCSVSAFEKSVRSMQFELRSKDLFDSGQVSFVLPNGWSEYVVHVSSLDGNGLEDLRADDPRGRIAVVTIKSNTLIVSAAD